MSLQGKWGLRENYSRKIEVPKSMYRNRPNRALGFHLWISLGIDDATVYLYVFQRLHR